MQLELMKPDISERAVVSAHEYRPVKGVTWREENTTNFRGISCYRDLTYVPVSGVGRFNRDRIIRYFIMAGHKTQNCNIS